MFNFFKKKRKDNENSNLKMVDLDQNPLKIGDTVDALRYDLGKGYRNRKGIGI